MRRILGWISPLGLVLGGVVGLLVFIALLATLNWTRRPADFTPATAVVNRIPWSSPTPTPLTPTETPIPSALPGAEVPPAGESGNIFVGGFIQVVGTGGDGLRLRSDPGLSGTVRFLALEAEIMQVEGGPEVRDDYTWWFLVAPYDPEVQGWAVENYMHAVAAP